MKNFTEKIASVLMILMISTAGIYLLPDGHLRMRYIISKIIPSVQYNPQPADTDEEDEEDDVQNTHNMTPKETKTAENTLQNKIPDTAPTEKLRLNRTAVKKAIGDNYLDAVISAGKLERWNPASFPLRIYFNLDKATPPAYVQEVKNAFSTWEKETNGFMKFTYINYPQGANFVCNFKSNMKNRGCDDKGSGTAAYQYFTYKNNGNIDKSIINFSAYHCNGQPYSQDLFYSFALHEIGHGLGLRGHSNNRRDLMYPMAESRGRAKISKADMNTLRAVYSIIPDVTDIPLSAEQSKKLIKSEDFFGNEYVRADFQIRQIKENIHVTPNNYGLYLQLARAYVEKKDYDRAINAYSEALKKIDTPKTAVLILCEVADLYIDLKRYPSAEKCLNKALTYGKNDEAAGRLLNIGVEFGRHNDYRNAVRLFQQTLDNAEGKELKELSVQNLCWIAYKSKDNVLKKKYCN